MREILFRAQDKYKGNWAEGYYTKGFRNPDGSLEDMIYMFSKDENERRKFNCAIVIPETVGQYTGLTVPSGKIFEHDIVTAKFKSNGARFNFAVKYSDEKGCYVFDNGCVKVPFNDIRSVRIIGNIHDNPELLCGADNG